MFEKWNALLPPKSSSSGQVLELPGNDRVIVPATNVQKTANKSLDRKVTYMLNYNRSHSCPI